MKQRKKVLSEVRMILTSHSQNEAFARSSAALFLTQLNPTVTEMSDIKCAVSEAVTNAIVHGYKDMLGLIYITMRLYEDREFRIEIKDKGAGMSNIEEAMKPLYTSDPAGERSGMGFTIMENFMDSLRVLSTPGNGTKVTMVKRLSPLPRVTK